MVSPDESATSSIDDDNVRALALWPSSSAQGHSGTLTQVSALSPRGSYAAVVSTFLAILTATVSVFTLGVVAWAFIWAAKRDGEKDRIVQRRLGIRRRTRLGR